MPGLVVCLFRVPGIEARAPASVAGGGKEEDVMMTVTEISQLFADITKAASAKFELAQCNFVLMNAGKQTEVAMAVALALQYQIKNGLA